MKPKKKTVLEWDYNDLDEFITKEFGEPNGIKEPYECVAYEEWNNDESHSIEVNGEYFYEPSITALREEKKWAHYMTSDILKLSLLPRRA